MLRLVRGAALLLCAAAIVVGSTTRLRAQAASDTVRTLLTGLSARAGTVEAVSGEAVVHEVYTGAMLKALRGAAGPTNPSVAAVAYRNHGLHVVDFWIDRRTGRWRLEVAELVATGLNEWGFRRNYGAAHGSARAPILIEACDGVSVVRWDVEAREAMRIPFDPQAPVPTNLARIRALLMFGDAAWDARAFRLGAASVVAGTECHTVSKPNPSPDYTGDTQLWIAPERGYALLRKMSGSFYRSEPARGSRTDISVTALSEVEKGLWLPLDVRHNSYAYVPGMQEPMAESCLVHFSRLAVNTELPSYLTTVQLPLGTGVMGADSSEPGAADYEQVGHLDAVLRIFDPDQLPDPFDKALLRPVQPARPGGDR